MDKKLFVETVLKKAICAAEPDVKALEYYQEETEDEFVEIHFKGGSMRRVNVTCNSLLAITCAVAEKLCY